MKITGGATIWARKTIESDIFFWKPAIWFKIWFYIVSKVNHKDSKQFKRGQGLFNFQNEKKYLHCTDDQTKKCIAFLRKNEMIDTKRSTRGSIITVLKYNLYQDLSTYKSTTKSTKEARSKHEGSTPINKYDKYDKNESIKKYIKKKEFSSLKEITPEVLQEISLKYKVPLSFVKLQFEKMTNWLEAKGKRYKNYKRGLQNWVINSAEGQIERSKKYDNKGGTDASHLKSVF